MVAEYGGEERNRPRDVLDGVVCVPVPRAEHQMMTRSELAFVMDVEIGRIEVLTELAGCKLLRAIVVAPDGHPLGIRPRVSPTGQQMPTRKRQLFLIELIGPRAVQVALQRHIGP